MTNGETKQAILNIMAKIELMDKSYELQEVHTMLDKMLENLEESIFESNCDYDDVRGEEPPLDYALMAGLEYDNE